MAERLATEYVKTCLVFTEAEMLSFTRLFAEHQVQLQVKIFDNGAQDIVFHNETGDEISLSFERKAGKYVCTGTCRLNNPKLVNLMRKSVAELKGDALVKRIYRNYTMVYQYKQGSVAKITELRGNCEKVIYEFKDTVSYLQTMFAKNDVEVEIHSIYEQIDRLLDLRNRSQHSEAIAGVDMVLKELGQRLYALEV